jgi:hypothetical protein
MSVQEEIFKSFFEELVEKGISTKLIDGLKELYEKRKIDSPETLLELIDGEVANGNKN